MEAGGEGLKELLAAAMAAAELARSDAAAEQKAGRAREQELAAKVAAMEAALWVRPPPPGPPRPPLRHPCAAPSAGSPCLWARSLHPPSIPRCDCARSPLSWSPLSSGCGFALHRAASNRPAPAKRMREARLDW